MIMNVNHVDPMTEEFTAYRALLFGIAYRMLGSVAEAEDLVQETYLRWQAQDRAAIVTPRAWLSTTITRLCIDQLGSARRRREEYVGVWLPEPLIDPAAPAPDAAAAMADSLGVAFLLMLEELSPVERAVFLLREAFTYDYAEIARIVDKSEASCRQMVSRAKTRIARPDPAGRQPTAQAEQVVRRFQRACATGNLRELLAVLTDDVVLYTDGGGRVRAARRPILAADRVSRLFLGIRERALLGAEFRLVRVNGDSGLLIRRRDGVVVVLSFAFAGDRIQRIYAVSNPDKLHHLPSPPGRN